MSAKVNMLEAGYLYCFFQDRKGKYLRQAVVSATSLRKVDPEAHITLLVDQVVEHSVFDAVIVKPDLVPKELWVKTGGKFDRLDGFQEHKMRLDLTPYYYTL